MTKRNYKLKDIYDYLLGYYNIEWASYTIIDNGYQRGVRNFDFNGKYDDCLKVIAVAYCGSRIKTISLDVDNESLLVYEITPYLHHYKVPEVKWKDFLAHRYNQEQSLTK